MKNPRTVTVSAAERKILVLCVLGLRDKEIAERLVIEPSTVKSHFRRLFNKFDISTRQTLVSIALVYNLIDHDRVREYFDGKIERDSSSE